MEINQNIEQFAAWISEILKCNLSEQDEHYTYTFQYAEEHTFILEKDKLESALQELREYREVSDTVISSGKTYEILVREEGQFFRYRPRDNDHVVEIDDIENDLKYCLMRPSVTFALFLIHKASLLGDVRELSRPMPLRNMYERWTEVKINKPPTETSDSPFTFI